MSDKPKITLWQITARASDQSFSRGESYYHRGSISHTVRRGDKIEAQCKGSYAEPYRVWASFADPEDLTTGCNCEYDWGGDCKHIVAMLLTYLHEPELFEEKQSIQDSLKERSKEDLIDLITMMITRYPDLQDIVDRPTPNQIGEGRVTLDTLSMRQELRGAFTSYGYDNYYEDYRNSPHRKINEFVTLAERFSDRNDWLTASGIYRAILEEFAHMDSDYYYDEDGDLAVAINDVVALLDACMQQETVINDDRERKAIFDALIGVYIWDIDFGGVDIGYEAPDIILKHIQREDIQAIRQRVKTARERKQNRRYSNWGTDSYAEFLMELEILDEVDPEIILNRLRAEGMDQLLVSKLLDLGRVDEAVMVIQDTIQGSFERIQALTVLLQHGQGEKAHELAEKLLSDTYDEKIANWLIEQYSAINKKEAMLRWQIQQIQRNPRSDYYYALKSTALDLNQWDTLRPQIITTLEKSKAYETLIRAYLNEQAWELAWATLPKIKQKNDPYGYQPRLDFEIAEASRHDMPERAIPVYIHYARQHIDYRNRDNYQRAATLLAAVQIMYDSLDEIERWELLIDEIRTEFKRLPALQDELNKAGL